MKLNFPEREVVFYVNKLPKINVKDVLQELGRVISEDDKPIRNLRLLEIQAHRVNQIVDDDMNADIITQTSATSMFIVNYFVTDTKCEIESNF